MFVTVVNYTLNQQGHETTFKIKLNFTLFIKFKLNLMYQKPNTKMQQKIIGNLAQFRKKLKYILSLKILNIK